MPISIKCRRNLIFYLGFLHVVSQGCLPAIHIKRKEKEDVNRPYYEDSIHLTTHGHTREDLIFGCDKREAPEVIAHLKAKAPLRSAVDRRPCETTE